MTVESNLVLIAPQFSDLTNLEDFINLAESLVGPKVCQRDLAVAYVTAHLIELSNRKGTGGSVNSESEGSLSRSYSNLSDSLLASTSYGLEYLRLLKKCGLFFTMRTF